MTCCKVPKVYFVVNDSIRLAEEGATERTCYTEIAFRARMCEVVGIPDMQTSVPSLIPSPLPPS